MGHTCAAAMGCVKGFQNARRQDSRFDKSCSGVDDSSRAFVVGVRHPHGIRRYGGLHLVEHAVYAMYVAVFGGTASVANEVRQGRRRSLLRLAP